MNRVLRSACVAAAGVLLLASCAKEETASYAEGERIAFRQWMEINRPQLVENYQPKGEYYVDVLDLGDTEAKPISDAATWVNFTFTGRNLAGDIVLTRNEFDANQVGSYTKFTRYIPYFKFYSGDNTNTSLLEGTYLAMRNKLQLGEKYAAQKGFPREVQLRYGTKVTLYMPSSVVSTGGVSGSGGYEGQKGYELRGGMPFVVTMEITDTVRNPLKREADSIGAFALRSGPIKIPKPAPEKTKAALVPPAIDPNDPYNDGFTWRRANDDIDHLFINLIYTPQTEYKYSNVYRSAYEPYNNFSKLEQAIRDTLVNRFGSYEGGPQKLPKDTVGLSGTAKIWYIGRFLDGFIFDSNIPGVRRLIYGETSTSGTPLSYTPESGGMIEAFYYSIPHLRFGQWASILTISTYAYGAAGVAGKTSTSSSGSSNNDFTNYLYNQNYLYGMGGYYDPYYNFYGGMYGNYYNPGVSNNTTTTTTISTEIPSFAPLLFNVYIEPQAE